jgi:hypothetical protein
MYEFHSFELLWKQWITLQINKLKL